MGDDYMLPDFIRTKVGELLCPSHNFSFELGPANSSFVSQISCIAEFISSVKHNK